MSELSRLINHDSVSPSINTQGAGNNESFSNVEGNIGGKSVAVANLKDQPGSCLTSFTNLQKEAAFSTKDVLTEAEQIQVLKSMINSADSFFIGTTYGISPLSGTNGLSNTMIAFFQGFAEKQSDPDFTAIFFYQKRQAEHLVFSSTNVSNKNMKWKKAVNVYNNLVSEGKVQGKKIDNIKANLYFLAGESSAHVLAGQHNKFLINDKGMNVTLGASLGNKSKPSWTDSGTIFYSPELAKQQLEYFHSSMLSDAVSKGKNNHVAKIETLDGTVVQQAPKDSRKLFASGQELTYSKTTKKLDQLTVLDNINEIKRVFKGQGFDLGDLHLKKATWINNGGSNYLSTSIDKKPIGEAFSSVFSQAKKGDSIYIKQGSKVYWDTGVFKVLGAAANAGAKIYIFSSFPYTTTHQLDYVYEQFRKCVNNPENLKNIEMKISVLDPSYIAESESRGAQETGRDHAKLYGIVKESGESTFMSGSYNLDSQSVQRSSENMIIVDDAKFVREAGVKHSKPEIENSSLLYNSVIKYYQNAKHNGLNLLDLHKDVISSGKYVKYVKGVLGE